MAVPVPVIIKTVTSAASSNSGFRTVLMTVIVAAIMPFLLVVLMLMAVLSGAESTTDAILDSCFYGADPPEEFTEEQIAVIDYLCDELSNCDEILDARIENGESFDIDMVRAVFYCLAINMSVDDNFDYDLFCDCFSGLDYGHIEEGYTNLTEEFSEIEIDDNFRKAADYVINYLKK